MYRNPPKIVVTNQNLYKLDEYPLERRGRGANRPAFPWMTITIFSGKYGEQKLVVIREGWSNSMIVVASSKTWPARGGVEG